MLVSRVASKFQTASLWLDLCSGLVLTASTTRVPFNEQSASFYPVDPPLIESDPQEYEGPEEPEQNPPPVPVEEKEEGGDDEEAEEADE
jgi:hypothetical protein